MSIEVLNLAFYVDGLTPTQKAVLTALANYANPDGGQAFPSVNRMSLMTSYSERAVRYALKDLREMGLIRVIEESKQHKTTEYQLDLQQMQALQARPATDAPLKPSRPATDAPLDNPDLQELHPDLQELHPSTYTRDLLTKDQPKIKDQGLEEKTEEEDYSFIPDSLQDPEFISAWKEWEVHRKQIKHKLTPLTQKKQLKKLSSVPLKIAIHTIEQSIEKGWQGLFIPKESDPIWQEADMQDTGDSGGEWDMFFEHFDRSKRRDPEPPF